MNLPLRRRLPIDAAVTQDRALRALADRYADAINQRNWTLYSNTLVLDAVLRLNPCVGPGLSGREAVLAQVRQTIGQHEYFILQPRAFTLLELKGPQACARVSYDEMGRLTGELETLSRRLIYIDHMVLGEDQVWRYSERSCQLAGLNRCDFKGAGAVLLELAERPRNHLNEGRSFVGRVLLKSPNKRRRNFEKIAAGFAWTVIQLNLRRRDFKMYARSLTALFVMGVLLSPVAFSDDTDMDRSHPKAFLKDSVITTKIKSKLAADHITSVGRIKVGYRCRRRGVSVGYRTNARGYR